MNSLGWGDRGLADDLHASLEQKRKYLDVLRKRGFKSLSDEYDSRELWLYTFRAKTILYERIAKEFFEERVYAIEIEELKSDITNSETYTVNDWYRAVDRMGFLVDAIIEKHGSCDGTTDPAVCIGMPKALKAIIVNHLQLFGIVIPAEEIDDIKASPWMRVQVRLNYDEYVVSLLDEVSTLSEQGQTKAIWMAALLRCGSPASQEAALEIDETLETFTS